MIDPQGGLQNGGAGGIQLEGQLHHPLEGLHHLLHHGLLVDLRQAHVHIQNIRPGRGLLQPLGQDVVHLPVFKGLLEPLFTGGIDPLPNDPHPVQNHHPAGAAHRRGDGKRPPAKGARLQLLFQGGDIVRGGAAASPQHLHPQLRQPGHGGSKLLRGNIVPAASGLRQTGIGLCHQGEAGPAAQFLHQGQQFPGPKGAVDANGVRPQAGEGEGHSGDRAAGEGAAVLLEGHGAKDGKAGVFLGRQQGGAGLPQVGHRLDGNKVRPGGFPRPDHPDEGPVGILKGEGAGGLQKLSQGADVQGRQGLSAGGLLRQGHSGGHQFLAAVPAAFRLAGIGPEGVGVNHLGSGPNILPVDVQDPLRMEKVHRLRQDPQGHPLGLEHGAHGPIQEDKFPALQQTSEIHHSRFLRSSRHFWLISPGSICSPPAGRRSFPGGNSFRSFAFEAGSPLPPPERQ